MQVISCIFRALFSNIVKFKDWQVRIFQQNFMKWGEGGGCGVWGEGVWSSPLLSPLITPLSINNNI